MSPARLVGRWKTASNPPAVHRHRLLLPLTPAPLALRGGPAASARTSEPPTARPPTLCSNRRATLTSGSSPRGRQRGDVETSWPAPRAHGRHWRGGRAFRARGGARPAKVGLPLETWHAPRAGLGQWDRAVDQYREALRLQPGDYATQYGLALALQKKGDDRRPSPSSRKRASSPR